MAGNARVEIEFAHTLQFMILEPKPVPLSGAAFAYLAYGNDYSVKSLELKKVHESGHLVRDSIKDFAGFSEKVQNDLEPFLKPRGAELLSSLKAYEALNLSIQLAAKKIHYMNDIAVLGGNDDVNFDGRPDGMSLEALKKLGPKTMRKALDDPEGLRLELVKKSSKLDFIPLDELYKGGRGVCRHKCFVAQAVFQVLKSLNPGLANLYLASIASPVDHHQWLQAAAVAPGKITFAFYDPTASTAKRVRIVAKFKKMQNEHYLGLPGEEEIRGAMGLDSNPT